MGQDVKVQYKNALGVAVNVDPTHPLPVDIGGGLTGLTANQGSANTAANAWPVKLTDGTDTADITAASALKVDGSAVTQPVSAASLPLPTGASTSALQGTGNTSLASIDTKTPALVTGRVPVDGSGVTQPVSASSLPLPTGAATETTLSAASAKLPATLGQKTMSAALAVSIASDQSAVPSSQSGTWNITNVSGTVSLPTGAATSSAQTTGNNSLSSIDGKLPATLGQKTSGASMAVVIASDQSAVPVTSPASSTASLANVSGSATSTTVLASNASRKNATFYNDSTAILYLKFGSTAASTTSFTVLIQSNGYYEMPNGSIYTGQINGIWSAAAGAVRVTELT